MRYGRLALPLTLLTLLSVVACSGGSSDGGGAGAGDTAGGDATLDVVPPLPDIGGADAGDGRAPDAPDRPDVAPDVTDVPPDAVPDVAADVAGDVPADVAADVPADVAADVPPDTARDVAPDVPRDTADTTDVATVPAELCRPCFTDADCGERGGLDAWCLPHGAAGSFCATACDDACPAGYDCLDVEVGRAFLRACLPEGGGECPCRPEHDGYETGCFVENEFGRCEGTRPCDGDCDAATPAAEDCNGVDDDCDGVTDAFSVDCSTVCGPGEDTCTDGAWSGCTAEEPLRCTDWETCEETDACGSPVCPPAPEETCNGVDDDCDGVTDGIDRPCETECGTGTETCTDGVWAGCDAPAPTLCYEYDTCTPFQTCDPSTCEATPEELCNGADDDCDGVIDNFERPCASDCGEGTETCVAGLWTICDAPSWRTCFDYETCLNQEMCVVTCPERPAEDCNGLDDDCDGVTDSMIRPCTSACGTGTERCTAGAWSSCTAPPSYTCLDFETCEEFEQCTPACPTAPPETCNGIDDDCDGVTDGMTQPCATDCGQGTETCVDGAWVDCTARQPITCTAYLTCGEQPVCLDECPPPPPEICNDRDDDCDGTVDGITRQCSTSCGVGEDVCEGGAWQGCDAPEPLTCMNFELCRLEDTCDDTCPPTPVEICNSVDDDCDGVTDDFTEPCDLPCGDGARRCVDGTWEDCDAPAYAECIDYETCETVVVCGEDVVCPFVPLDVCDGVDNDCDGETDEEPPEEICADPPASVCEGDVVDGYEPVGACVDGACVYTPLATLCPWGCTGDACDPCEPECLGVPCGDDGCGGSCGACVDGAPLDPNENAVLNILARWFTPTTSDHRVVISESEALDGTFHGQMYYVLADDSLGGFPIYQLRSGDDWMLANQSTEDDYTLQRIVGYVGIFLPDRVCEITRWYSAARGDRAAAFCGEDLSGAGYVAEFGTGSGFERYGTDCFVGLELEGAELRLVANRVAGGAIGELWWNGRQFLNRFDFGRYVQTTFRNGGDTVEQINEAGDRYGCPGWGSGAWAHGAPLYDASVEGGVLHTETHPLQWEPAALGGGPEQPVAWLGTIAKDVEVDFGGSPHVAAWDVAIQNTGGAEDLDMQILRAAVTADFSRQLVFDAYTQTTTDVSAVVPQGSCLDAAADDRLEVVAGAAIAATQDGAYALGVYRRAPRNQLGFCRGTGDEGGATGADYRSVSVVERLPNGRAPGLWTYRAYLLVGTLDDVRTAARELFLAGN